MRLSWLLLAIPFGATACMSQYKFPTPEQPHAILKVRRQYVEKAGVSLSELVVVDEQRAYSESTPVHEVGGVRTDAIMLHPGTSDVEVRLVFSHQVTRTRQVQESYSCGTYDSPRTCYRTRTQYYQETVVDAACIKQQRVTLDDGATYIVDVDFHGASNCRMRCVEQVPDGPGTFKNKPCEARAAPTP